MTEGFQPLARDFHRYLVIDTETANQRRESLCALAALMFKDGSEVGRLVTLVNPQQDLWTNTHLHGISREDVAKAPTIDQIAPALRMLIEGSEVQFAHWAPFDASVIDRIVSAVGLPPLATNWRCTCKLSRAAFPDLPNHRLPTVAASIGAAIRHHDAVSDAEVCAAIVHTLYGLRSDADEARLRDAREVMVALSRDQMIELVNSAVLTADAAMEDDDEATWRFIGLSVEAVAACERAYPDLLSHILCKRELRAIRKRLALKDRGARRRRPARPSRRAA